MMLRKQLMMVLGRFALMVSSTEVTLHLELAGMIVDRDHHSVKELCGQCHCNLLFHQCGGVG